MLTSIEAKNFKGFRHPTKINIRPITLLFGPNSAGKSTILDVLGYAWKLLSRSSDEANPLPGRNPDSFEKLVRGHDTSRTISLSIAGSGDFDETDKHLLQLADDELASSDAWEALLSDVHVELQIEYDDDHPLGVIQNCVGQIAGHPFVKLEKSKKHQSDVFLRGDQLKALANTASNGTSSSILEAHLQNWLDTQSQSPGEWLHVGTLTGGQIPDWTSHLHDLEMRPFAPLLHYLVAAPFQVIRRQISDVLHIGPLRQLPPRNYQPQSADSHSWHDGLAAWAKLFEETGGNTEPELLNHVNRWLSKDDLLDTGHEIAVDRWKLLPQQDAQLEEMANCTEAELRDVLSKLDSHRRIQVRDLKRDVRVAPAEVGSGIAQLVPIVVAAMSTQFKNQLLCIEQPELHVHPGLQTSIADLFLGARNRLDDRHFLVETHSEHLLLRLLKRIRQTMSGVVNEHPVPEKTIYSGDDAEEIRRHSQPRMEPEDLAVYWVQRDGDATVFERLHVNYNGDFEGGWPKGFFDERMEEL